MKRTVKKGAVAAAIAAALICAPCIARSDTAHAEETAGAELIPVETASDTVYKYFEAPGSVFTDALGTVIADNGKLMLVGNDLSVTSRDIDADKALRHGDFIVTLENGALRSYYGDSTASYSAALFKDIAISGDTLYAVGDGGLTVMALGSTSFDASTARTVGLTAEGYRRISPALVTASGGSVYVSVDSPMFENKQDIILVDTETGISRAVLTQSNTIAALAAMDGSGVVYTLTRDKITGYTMSGGLLKESCAALDARMNTLCAYDGALYALNTLDGLVKISAELSEYKLLVASAADVDGFFNVPSGAAVKNSTLYVADEANDRIAIYGADVSYYTGGFSRPTSVACDSAGTVYFSHDGNTVSAIGEDGTDITVDGSIRQIAADSEKTLYILTDTGLWRCVYGGAPERLSQKPYKAIAIGFGRDDLYALTYSSAVKLEISDGELTEQTVCAVQATACSLAVDLAGNVFALTPEHIFRTDKDGNVKIFTLTQGGEKYSLGFTRGQIVLCTVENEYVHYGDAVIVDPYKHRVFATDGSASGLGVKLIDDDYDVPDIVEDDEPKLYSGLIRLSLYDAPVFSLPMETPAIYTIAKDRKVIVPMYELEDAREYALVLIDNLATGKLIQGYVYKNALSDPLPYAPPPTDVGTVYTKATPVYKWPSINAEILKDFAAVDRNTRFTILNFVMPYRDDYNNLWYRISINSEYEGYILASNLSLMDYEPVFIRPSYDAEIIEYDGRNNAAAYKLTDGEYVAIDVTFPVGTQVEVIGVFDTSVKYTQIKYLDPAFGTLTCYVETAHLKYKGTNIVLIVAIIVIIITIILAAIIIARVLYVKKKRLVTPDVPTGNDKK